MGSGMTALGIATLALLMERPMHPYEMYQTLVQRTEDRIVKVRPGSLYHTVDRLLEHGLVRATGTDREGNRPERTTYEITQPGELALTEHVTHLLSTPVNEYPQFPLAIGEAHNLPAETVAELLEQRLVRLRSNMGVLDAGRAAVTAKNLERRYWLELTYQQAVLQAEIDWIEGFIAELRAGEIAW